MRGNSGSVVEWTFRDEAPDADIRDVGVTARENISAGCAGLC